MNCSDVQRVLPEIDDGAPNAEFQAHVQSCPSCSALLSDLELISSEARQLAESEEPSPRLWFRIADELRAEGLIREPAAPTSRPVLVLPKRRRWNPWWLVPVAAVLVVGSAYLLKPKPRGELAQQPSLTLPQDQTAINSATRSQAVEGQAAASLEDQQAEDQQFLDEVSQSAPMMKAAYENELRSVNSYINDARAYAQQNPNDEDARRHLLEAYEQKQMLYQMALNNIQ